MESVIFVGLCASGKAEGLLVIHNNLSKLQFINESLLISVSRSGILCSDKQATPEEKNLILSIKTQRRVFKG